MDLKKIRKTVIIALFVSLAAQIHFDFLTEGFIIAMSPLVMAIFVYCYEDLPPVWIICLSGIFSPVLRMVALILTGEPSGTAAGTVLPDAFYYFAYALSYTLIYRFVIRAPKTTRNFPHAIFFCDCLSNLTEIGCRSLLTSQALLSYNVLAYIALISICRTLLIMMVIVAVDTYGGMLISQEREREYGQLLINAATVESELSIMNKNVSDVENVTKTAYELYHLMRDRGYPDDIVKSVLSIAKNTHEIKGDYQNVLGVLNGIFLHDLDQKQLRISEIISLEKSNVLAMAEKNGYNIDVQTTVIDDFIVSDPFKMMSVIRNLMTNAAEAIGSDAGTISVTAKNTPENDHMISIRDDGPGISEDEIGTLFLEGYSTKFDPRTGNIQRGLGLCIVKEYIESDCGGRIDIKSEKGKYTQFDIIIPSRCADEGVRS